MAVSVCQTSRECCFEIPVKAPEKGKIKHLKWVLLLHDCPNKVFSLGTQVEVIYQCLFTNSLSLSLLFIVSGYFVLFCFVICFHRWPATSNSSLNFECKISRQQGFLKRAKPPRNSRAMICSLPFRPDENKAFSFLTRRQLKSSIHMHTLQCNLLHTTRT